jgi:hypothetical protein
MPVGEVAANVRSAARLTVNYNIAPADAQVPAPPTNAFVGAASAAVETILGEPFEHGRLFAVNPVKKLRAAPVLALRSAPATVRQTS